MAKPFIILCLVVALLPFASAAGCNTTVHVGDRLQAGGYTATLNSISTTDSGAAVGSISITYAGFTVWSGQMNSTGSYSFKNPLDGSNITITDCQNVPGAGGHALLGITGVDYTLIPGPNSAPSAGGNTLPTPLPPPSSKNVTAQLTIYTPSSPNGQRLSLPMGETVPAGDYNLRLVGTSSSGTASVEISDTSGNLLGTIDVGSGTNYAAPAVQGASPLSFVLDSILGAGGESSPLANAAYGTAMQDQVAGAAVQAPSSAPASSAKQQQSSQIQQLIAVLVIFIGMIVASFIVLYQLSRNTVGDPTMRLLQNETRAGIVKQLAEADRIPTDLANSLDKSKAAISEHLDILVGEGLVERVETPGKKFVFYRLTQKGRQVMLRMAG